MTQPLRLDARQQRIHYRLALLGPGPAAFYRDAVRILLEGKLESTAHLLAHLGREIESSLREVLIERVPSTVSKKKKDNDTHRLEVQQIVAAYGLDPNGPAAQLWLQLARRDFEYALHHQAHRDALMPPRTVDAAFREFWEDWETLLDEVLDRFECRYIDHLQTIKELQSKSVPNAEDIKRLRNAAPNNVQSLAAFFQGIDERWLLLLRNGGFFSSPPAADPTVADGRSPFTPWPASAYLVRLLETADAATLTLIGQICVAMPDTQNRWVHQDLAAIAAKVPLKDAVALTKALTPHVRSSMPSRLPERLAKLSERLCVERRPTAGLTALRSLIEPTSDGEAPIDEYEHELILRDVVPRIVAVTFVRAFDVLCECLEKAVAALIRRDGHDDGCGFRPAIEDHRQNDPNAERHVSDLIVAVRDAGDTIARTRPCLVSSLVQRLEHRSPVVFRRLAMHLLRTHANAARSDVERYLLNEADRGSISLWHERRLLERDGVRVLTSAAREKFIDAIREGPTDVDAVRAQGIARGEPLTDSDVEAYRWRWRRSYLSLLEDYIPGDLREGYDATIAKFGRSEHPDFLGYIGEVWTGPSSPQSADDLAKMSVEEVLAFLKAWTPTPRFDGPFPSREGLARQLKGVVASNPTHYASDACRFVGQRPVYVRTVFEGLTDAADRSREQENAKLPTFTWGPVLDLARWALSQSANDEISVIDAVDAGEDPGWNWTRTSVARLLVAGLRDGSCVIPPSEWPKAFGLLTDLLKDSEDNATGDAIEVALNSTRGAAVEALILYARQCAVAANAPDGSSRLNVAPEAKELLEQLLDAKRERSRATRAMIGIQLSLLIALDDQWVRAHLVQLLDDYVLRGVLWDGYLWHNYPTRLAFDVLREPLKQRIRETMGNETNEASPRLRTTVAYVSSIYLYGPEDAADVLDVFLEVASPIARAELLKTIGFSFYHEKETIAPEFLERARVLWQKRRDSFEHMSKEEAAVEARPFGWWFASGKFDVDWSLEELTRVLHITTRIDLDFAVADRLASIADTRPLAAVRCASALVESDETGWRVLSCRRGLHETLAVALRSADSDAHVEARALVSRFTARGHNEFVDLA